MLRRDMVLRASGILGAAALVVCSTAASPARATGFTDIGQDIRLHDDEDDFTLELDGYLRLRGELLHNLDLDRGTSPSDQVLFPVPIDDPQAQTLYETDMRLRTDLAIYAPGGMVAIKLRIDTLDNLALGSTPDGAPSAATTQRALENAIHIRRAYGEVLTPIGVLAAGRMGNHWGLGMLANGGDCADCDSGDAQDRVAFLTPIAGHVWAASFDLTSSGPQTGRRAGFRPVDITATDDVRTVTFAVLNWLGDEPRARRHRAGRTTFEYGAYVSHRWQDGDIPATYVPTATPVTLTPQQVMPRGFQATAADVWARVQGPDFRIELEAAFLHAQVGQSSLVPGVLLRDRVTSTQFGAAIESELLDPRGPFTFGLDAGFASGDSAPGFGSHPRLGQAYGQPGDVDGPQANVPYDNTVDNFRFHPDYRIDRILFRELIGTVTDAVYLRPHARLRAFDAPFGRLDLDLFAVGSFAVEPTSTPGQDRPLGLEIDPGLSYQSREGFGVAFDYALLIPFSGLDNPAMGLRAQPAQLARLRLMYAY
jgi:uncharacterized protein (TIGR04551 family)